MKIGHWLKVVLMAGLFFFPQLAQAQITGSAHDFTSSAWGGGEICRPCHTPHNADMTVPNAPLWNHAPTAATFQVYAGPGTLNATVGQPQGTSLLCLSCHDGTVALDSFAGATGTTFITGNANVGTDLRNDHPISFTYDAALAIADSELFDPATTPAVASLLIGGRVECASCHDVHNNSTIAANGNLLRGSMTGSALCLTCHNK